MLNKFIISTLALFSMSYAIAQNVDSLVDRAIKISLIHMENSVNEIGDSNLFPTYGTKELHWVLKTAEQWTSGFYPGCLWYAYELSGDRRFEKWAGKWTEALKNEVNNDDTHDLGFKFGCTFGNGLRLGEHKDYAAYKDVLMMAAKTLSKRYNEKLGCLSSDWDAKYFENTVPVITDIMMNLELLLWASENGGPKEWADYAVSHALKTYKDFRRPDGGTYHIVRYDSITGEIINKGTLQGEGDETTWSRGQAWAAYGMVVLYRYTKDKRFLEYAINLADYFIDNLEDDHVSLWDFNTKIKHRDVSATCIVASALLEMVKYIEDSSLQKHYTEQAEKILVSLCQKPYYIFDTTLSPILTHSVHYYTIKSSIDVPAIFADYYFLEALIRYKAKTKE